MITFTSDDMDDMTRDELAHAVKCSHVLLESALLALLISRSEFQFFDLLQKRGVPEEVIGNLFELANDMKTTISGDSADGRGFEAAATH